MRALVPGGDFMSGERPWLKFYPQSWRSDEMLRNCSLAARGLWIEMIALMHTSERYGFLLINGKPPSDRQLQRQTGAESLEEIGDLIAELERENVFSRDSDGVIFSRKMVRDAKLFAKASNFGKRGAKAKALREKEETPTLKGGDEDGLKGGQEGGLEETHRHREQRIESPPVSPKLKGRVINSELPEDWQPEEFGEDSQCHSIIAGWTRLEFERQLERFRSHHSAIGSRFKNWQRAWATWVLNSPDFARPQRDRSGPSGYSGGGSSFADHILAERAGSSGSASK